MNILDHLQPDGLIDLCEKIKMPGEVSRRIAEVSRSFDFSGLEHPINLLFDCRTGPKGVEAIDELLRECGDDSMFLWLAIWLGAVLHTHEWYRRKHIGDSVFFETMGCFTRFVREYKERYGVYGFDRSSWTYRQIAMRLYRLGALEYEMTDYNGPDIVLEGKTVLKQGENILSVHIPSDARLDGESCHESYRAAAAFFGEYYPDYRYGVFYCNTWLLSPNLRQLLPDGSGILNFQSDYRICGFNEESNGYKVWVFKDPTLEPPDFPENTSLQRSIKRLVLNGGKIGCAAGFIDKKAICSAIVQSRLPL